MHGGMGNRSDRAYPGSCRRKAGCRCRSCAGPSSGCAAAHLLLDAKQAAISCAGVCVGFKGHSAVQEPCLIGELHRLGLVERRNATRRGPWFQPRDRVAQMALAISDVRSQRKIDEVAHSSAAFSCTLGESRSTIRGHAVAIRYNLGNVHGPLRTRRRRTHHLGHYRAVPLLPLESHV